MGPRSAAFNRGAPLLVYHAVRQKRSREYAMELKDKVIVATGRVIEADGRIRV
jgi:hypothetical protein